MAVVVEQTIPFSSVVLDLAKPQRWNVLLPLIRPSTTTAQTAKGQTILIDTAHAHTQQVHIAAIGKLGNFSSKLLDERDVTAIITEQHGAGILTAKDVLYTLAQAGVQVSHGLVTVRSGTKHSLDMQGTDVLDVEVNGELELDHLLHLIGSATRSCRSSIHHVVELVKDFQKNVCCTYSRFHTEKAHNKPAILHASGSQGFKQARHAISKDLESLLKSKTTQDDGSVLSAHYSDVNGLSRLENYILAGEIGQCLEAQHLPYRLSHSTILDHEELARGFAISIAAVPSHFLEAQSKAKPHQQTPSLTSTTNSSSARQFAMSFSDTAIRNRIVSGCDAVIQAEPIITEYDTLVGDGDCGFTLRDGAKQVLQFIIGKDLSRLPTVVGELVQVLEVNMGGTSGALYCIFLTAFAASLASDSSMAAALQSALQQLMKYTKARVGDRTMMDALIPFVDTLQSTNDVQQALQKARTGVDDTKTMEATLGRSAYLDDSATQGTPDPGAYGLLVLLEGMSHSA